MQFKEKYLKFVDKNEDPETSSKYYKEVQSLKNILEPSTLDQQKEDQEKNTDNSKKILYVKDIMKEVMATQLSKHLGGKTLSELTK